MRVGLREFRRRVAELLNDMPFEGFLRFGERAPGVGDLPVSQELHSSGEFAGGS